MLKFLLISIIIFYLVIKGINLVTKYLFLGGHNNNRKPRGGNVNVNFNSKQNHNYKGGEYVDYEEVDDK